jgi:phosphatidate cytidylyltransferase
MMIVKRVLSSLVIIGLLALIIPVAWVCSLVITLIIVFSLYEFFTMLEHKGIAIYKYFGIGLGAVIPLSILLRFELTRNWEFLFIVLAVLSLILMQFRRRDNSGAIVGISTTIFGVMYLSWFLSFLIRIRYLGDGGKYIIMLLLITKLGDMGAYVFGSAFGKTPLIPRISPKKSVEGALAGLACSLMGALVCKTFLDISYPRLAVLGIFLGILGQLGDLSESLMKRDCQVKDSGVLFPGLGGFLDLVDSLLLTAPVFYFYINAVLHQS